MKNLILTLVLASFSTIAFAQNVGINTTGATPDASAALDIDYPDKGLLIPRVALTSTTDVATIPAPATSLLVYNTNAAMTGGALGYWYWDGAAWVQAIGPQGPIGPMGPAGPQGPAGAAGAQGPIGLTGAAGAQGPIGLTGAQGPIGLTGPAGAQGPIGLTGATGAAGAQGPIGLTGAQGPIGLTGPAGAQGPIGLTGATGAAGPQGIQGVQGPAGADGVTNMNGITLSGSRTIATAAWVNVAGMSFSFTAQTTSAIVMFSSSGYGFTNSMSYVQFRIRNGATNLGMTQTKIQNYDDVTGTITPWSCTYTRYITGLTVGNSYTLSVQGKRDGISGTYDAIIDTGVDGHHMSLSVVQ